MSFESWEWEKRTTISTGPPRKRSGINYLSSWELAWTMSQIRDLSVSTARQTSIAIVYISPTSSWWHQLRAHGLIIHRARQQELIMAWGRNISREGIIMACIYLFFVFFFLKGYFLSVWQEIVCCVCVCWCVRVCMSVRLCCAAEDSWANWGTDFILYSLLSVKWTQVKKQKKRFRAGQLSWHSDFYFCTCTFEYYQLQLKYTTQDPILVVV